VKVLISGTSEAHRHLRGRRVRTYHLIDRALAGVRVTKQDTMNHPLRWERLERGWTQEDVAAALNRLIVEAQDDETPVVTARYVGRWERTGIKPDPQFRKYFVLLYGRPASELGLLSPDELVSKPSDAEAVVTADRVRGDLRLGLSSPVYTRKAFLQGMVGAGSALFLRPSDVVGEAMQVLTRITGRPTLSRDDEDAYEAITSAQLHIYWDSPSHSVFEAALSHMQLGIHLQRSAGRPPSPDMARSMALTAMLAGRVAFFDLERPAIAEQCLSNAREFATYAEDPQLRAAIAGTMSFIPGFAGNLRLAYSWIDRAHKHLRPSPGRLIRSWLHSVSSEVSARNGDQRRAVDQIIQAEDALGGNGRDADWLDFYNEARLDGFAGYTYLQAGETAKATDYLQRSLESIGNHATRQKAVLLLDLASARAAKEPEEALQLAESAVEILSVDWYAAAFNRISELREQLPDERYRRTLDDVSASLNEQLI